MKHFQIVMVQVRSLTLCRMVSRIVSAATTCVSFSPPLSFVPTTLFRRTRLLCEITICSFALFSYLIFMLFGLALLRRRRRLSLLFLNAKWIGTLRALLLLWRLIRDRRWQTCYLWCRWM